MRVAVAIIRTLVFALIAVALGSPWLAVLTVVIGGPLTLWIWSGKIEGKAAGTVVEDFMTVLHAISVVGVTALVLAVSAGLALAIAAFVSCGGTR
ncbi:MAG: hypothetical protein NVSMB14_14140 [Isosphaeraceae bacterium]